MHSYLFLLALLASTIFYHSNSFAGCSDFLELRPISHAELVSFQEIAKSKGFSNELTARLAKDRPEILKLIAQHPNAKPKVFYRGLRIKNVSEFKPNFIQNKQIDETRSQLINQFYNGVESNGKNFFKDIWVTPNPDYALMYARLGSDSGGVVIEYEIPDFIAYTFEESAYLEGKAPLEYQLQSSIIKKSELTFITRIANLKVKNYPSKSNLSDQVQIISEFPMSEFLDKWVNHDEISLK